MTRTREQAAAERAQHTAEQSDRPRQRTYDSDQANALGRVRVQLPQMRERTIVEHDGIDCVLAGGFASTTEDPYEMYDMFGPYTEVVSLGAFDTTLSASPLVEFTINHGAGGGIPMAHTRNETLVLEAVKDGDVTGLKYGALCDPRRSDVNDALLAMERGDLAEASFKFRITKGLWSPDYSEYRIEAVDLHRGDVSACNFGANPNATSGLRADDGALVTSRATTAVLERTTAMPDRIVFREDSAPFLDL